MARLGCCVLLLVVAVFFVGMEATMSAAAAPFLAPVVKPGDTVGFISPGKGGGATTTRFSYLHDSWLVISDDW